MSEIYVKLNFDMILAITLHCPYDVSVEHRSNCYKPYIRLTNCYDSV